MIPKGGIHKWGHEDLEIFWHPPPIPLLSHYYALSIMYLCYKKTPPIVRETSFMNDPKDIGIFALSLNWVILFD